MGGGERGGKIIGFKSHKKYLCNKQVKVNFRTEEVRVIDLFIIQIIIRDLKKEF